MSYDLGVFYTTDPLTSEWRQAAIRGLFETGVLPGDGVAGMHIG